MRALAHLLASPEHGRFYGVTVGVVTNNQDPDSLGRVKVKLPWLSDQDESFWARVVAPMAGKDRGLYLLPEIDDEVLVAFEHGMIEYPYVLGALWNGKDNPPETNSNGKNNMRTLKSRSGMIIRLDDTDGSEKIEISDASGKNSIVIDV
ncbi:MAG: phage tail protein, partial [Oscillochloris sp.]|nr:phage tail protein [Oscillochloris sp.]